LQALATLATLAQISTPSAAHFLKSHQLLVQKFAADRDRQRSSFKPFRVSIAARVRNASMMDAGVPSNQISFVRFVVISQQSKIFLHVESHNGFVSNSLRLNFH
jgi:hypothetical protein